METILLPQANEEIASTKPQGAVLLRGKSGKQGTFGVCWVKWGVRWGATERSSGASEASEDLFEHGCEPTAGSPTEQTLLSKSAPKTTAEISERREPIPRYLTDAPLSKDPRRSSGGEVWGGEESPGDARPSSHLETSPSRGAARRPSRPSKPSPCQSVP